MGTACDYRCPNCRYNVEFMVSGYSFGMDSHCHAVLCTDCRDLHVCSLPGHPWDLSDGELPSGAVLGRFVLTCPKSPSHHVVPWFHPSPCPRCATILEQGTDLILWD